MTGARIRSLVLLALLLAGLIPRVLALSSPQRVAASISEDGYLMLTVARNLAHGRGLSTAAGTIPTNGVQPLVTFVWAGVHAVAPDDATALRAVVAIELVTAVAGALLVGALAGHLFARHPDVATVSRVSAAVWFASPLVIRHTLNGLETGLYAASIAGVLLLDARWREQRTLGRAVAIGGMLGVIVLVRNDAAVLVAAYTLVRAFVRDAATPRGAQGEGVGHRLGRAVAAGAASLVAASPWLAFNLTRFGHIVPISGRSQSLDTALGESLVKLPRALAEYVLAGMPLPDATQVAGPWPIVLSGMVACVVWAVWRRRHTLGLVVERPLVVLVLFVAGLATYYGAFFAAGHFLSRYLFPLSLFTVPLAVAAVLAAATPGPVARAARGATSRSRLAATAAAGLWLAALLAADVRYGLRADRHPHMHVVEWVRANVADEEWVAAPQSGTVGYFHDRTINLDGKVNPEALRARDMGRLFAYVADDTDARYIVDWYGLARWLDDPASVKDERDGGLLARHFRYVVKDSSANLVVLARVPRTAKKN